MLYKCERCGYTTDRKSSLHNHLSRKHECKSLLSTVTVADLRLKLQSGVKVCPNSSLLDTNPENVCPNSSLLDTTCTDCGKVFKCRTSKYKHKRLGRCTGSMKADVQEMKVQLVAQSDQLAAQAAEIAELKKRPVGSTSIVKTKNTNNINIHINGFGKEDISYITPEAIAACLKQVYGSVPALIKAVHFHPDHPENHNVRYPNKRDKFLKLAMGDGTWQHVPKREAIDRLIESGHARLEDALPEAELTPTARASFERYANKMNGDQETIDDVRGRVESTLLDCR